MNATVIPFKKKQKRDARPAWLIVASTCDCCKTAISIFERDRIADDDDAWADNDPSELAIPADAWQPAVADAPRRWSAKTGDPISPCCTAVYVEDKATKEAIEDEALRLLYAIAKEGRK
ncbi:hypothetical protein [Methylocystis sp. ATCC 49242]|uniref:hypothetical protein n=1 Tax=Methylocystis sp. ATCC 49242 TaxID=622637 RepID=UPI0001F86868|nr:hypothetical protein [Methylocystis sp. ATCC 49242]